MATKNHTTKKTTKKAPARAQGTKVRRVSTPKQPVMKSFRPAKTQEPFFTFKITQQTIYWTILAVLVLALGLWVLTISIKVNQIYDEIEASSVQLQSVKPVNNRP